MSHKSYFLNQLLGELFFGFLVPNWKKLDLLLGLTAFSGILAVLGRKNEL